MIGQMKPEDFARQDLARLTPREQAEIGLTVRLWLWGRWAWLHRN